MTERTLLFSVAWLPKCLLTILELNWYERYGDGNKKLKDCLQVLTQNTTKSTFHVVERTRTDVKCTKMKNARAKRAKLLFFVVEYANM